jgi:hypothetical protein
MNERIKELSKEAFEYALSQHPGSDEFQPIWTEKFAEMIVRECMAMCKTSVGNADYNTGRLHCLENIKERFGIEQ